MDIFGNFMKNKIFFKKVLTNKLEHGIIKMFQEERKGRKNYVVL